MTGYRVPDSLEPIEAFRCWNLIDGKLVSITNGQEWTPGETLAAKCIDGMGAGYRWVFARDGMTHAEACERANPQVDVSGFGGSSQYVPSMWAYEPPIPAPPALHPPDGYGFALERIVHDAPAEDCACGIYAVTSEDRVPPKGQVYGKVKLWGKIIPGNRGYRAEFAYPSEFWVPSDMAPDDTLLDFDVPIVLKDDLPHRRSSGIQLSNMSVSLNGVDVSNWLTSYDLQPVKSRFSAWHVMVTAAAINFGCATFNVLKAFHVF